MLSSRYCSSACSIVAMSAFAFSTRAVSVAGMTLIATIVASKRSEEHTSELQSLMRISYAVFCLKKKRRSVQRKSERTPIRQNHARKYTTDTREELVIRHFRET